MNSIYKYRIYISPTDLILPRGSILLHVGEQDDAFYVWVLLNRNERVDVVTRKIRCESTGSVHHNITGKHIGTIQMKDKPFVWHFFDEGEESFGRLEFN